MNYFITHCDINFLEHAEKLFESLNKFSNTKVIFLTIDFDYINKHFHVINIRHNVDKNNNTLVDKKAYAVFLKPELCKNIYSLSFINKEDIFCYIDADCLAMKNCDDIFNKYHEILDYPLLNDGCHDYMIMYNRGDPFTENGIDYNLTLEGPLIKYLGYDINNRKKYLQTGVFLFNYSCIDFFDFWYKTCFDEKILSNWKYLTPFHEETVINCLLWQKNHLKSLGQVLVNIPYYDSNDDDLVKIKHLLNKLKNPSDADEFIYTFTKIPSKTNMQNLYFLHGKHSQFVYDFINYNMSDLYLKIHSPSLGDTIASTPTLRKLSKTYNKKINVITHVKAVFANNPYVNNIYSFEDFDNLKFKINKQNMFETFLGCGIKNQYGVEKKHNTIDIRQFHAIDLGFMLLPEEMEYDYVADSYEDINNLPDEYICLHVSETWESRTYKKESWQNLINDLNNNGIAVVLIGKNGYETGFYNIQKNVFNLQINNGLDLTNKLNLSQSWHVINKAKAFVTMDSGPMHLAGTTDTFIIQLGSSINNRLRAPYRNNSQDYKYKYLSGSCNIFCASDMKYGIKEWGNINGVPPLIKCLENKPSYDCHPSVYEVLDFIKVNFFNDNRLNLITVAGFDKNECSINYVLNNRVDGKVKIKIIDYQSGFILHEEVLKISPHVNWYTAFNFCKNIITNKIKVIFELNNKPIFNQIYDIFSENNNIFSNYKIHEDLNISSYFEILNNKIYFKYGLDIDDNDIVVDIGSNQGAFIKYCLDKKASKIYCCEPNPNCISLINKYYGSNKNIYLNEYAISNKNGSSSLHLLDQQMASGSGKIYEADANQNCNYSDGDVLNINTITFKHFIESNAINYIDFLKVDCEGGEVFIFTEENKDFIKNNVNKISLEFHNEKYIDIINYLKELNFEVNFELFGENLGIIYAKSKKQKIGLLVTAYNCHDYVDDCLKSWLNSKSKHNIKIAVNSGMFSDYKNLDFPDRNKETLEKLSKYNFDFFVKTSPYNLLDEDSSRNQCLDYLIKNQKCDLIWIVDADEIYKQNEIDNIINYVNQNDAVYYNITFKNYTFTKNYFSDFSPPRIFWVNKNSGINKFYFDNHILYNDGSLSENDFSRTISKEIAYVDHFSWLAQDSRTKEKIVYQNLRFAGDDDSKCSYKWDADYDCMIFNDTFFKKRNLNKPFEYEPAKYLFITPHLSTGGAPKYLEWLISKIKKENVKIKVIEWNLYSSDYTVQRDNIINIIGNKNFYSVGGYWENKEYFISKENEFLQIIKDFNPDYIHLNEFSEDFAIQGFTDNILNFLYDRNRKFKLYETSHKANIDFSNKTYVPDELWLCSEYHIQKAITYNFNYRLIEMELDIKNRPDRKIILESLGLNPNKLHVLQVGLFCKNKNQKYTFDIAKKLINLPIDFHFVGNQCYIDDCNIDKNQINCKIWGERKDVDLFMSCMDVFVMPSFEELNPIALKEALSWGMPCFASKIETLYNKYKNNSTINFIENDNFENFLKLHSKKYQSLMQNKELNSINISFNPKPKVEILGDDKCSYKIRFIDSNNNFCHYETQINDNMWCEASILYFIKWKIEVINLTKDIKFVCDLNLKNQIVHIINESSSLGDNIAWMSSIEEFQKKHDCKINLYTNKKQLFEKEYPSINFYEYNHNTKNIGAYCIYKLGCFDPNDKNLCAKDWRLINLCDIANEILGLEFNHIKPKITFDKNYKNNLKKYVCIATQSTSQSRYWSKEKWEIVVNHLQKNGYVVVCVDKHYSFGDKNIMNYCPANVDIFAGNESFENIINLIKNSEFFIGLSSGLSWLAWALDKKVLTISGSVKDYFEFETPYRASNKNVCNGCFNNSKHKFNASDWLWCPENKNFECSKNISEEMVIQHVNKLIS
jgi:autotransporter strand-loop-strand O-heptosyltransferase